MRLLAAGMTTLLLGLALVPVVRALARRLGMVAAPREDRWHAQPTALLGGAGIVTAFAGGLALFPDAVAQAWPILAAAALLFLAGLLDDVVQLRPLLKLGLQLAAAGLVVAAGLVLPWTHQPVVDGAITFVWLVGITNAVNLLDNMDGLAAGLAAIACAFLAVTFLQNGQTELAVLPALLGGAALGFLTYNFKPASIFMGNGGSMFLGAMLGGLALLSSYGRSRSVASVLLTPVLIMMIPILDTTLVAITRRLRGQPVSVGGCDHTSHRLVALGASERRAVVILYGLAAMSGAVSLVVRELRVDALLAVIPGFALVVAFFALYLGLVPVRERSAVGGAGRILSPSRRVTMMALDAGLCALAYVMAFAIRWDFDLPDDQRTVVLSTLPLIAVVEMTTFWAGGMYRVRWNEPSVDALVVIGRSSIGAAGLAAIAVLGAYGFSGPSRGALVLNGLLVLVLVTGSRLAVVMLRRVIVGESAIDRSPRPVLICGAGDRGAFLAREVLADPDLGLRPVGFLSDGAPAEARALGLPVFKPSDLRDVIQSEGVRDVLIAGRRIDGQLTGQLQGLGLRIRAIRWAIEEG